MAHPRIIAQRQAIAVQRLMASAHKLAKRHSLDKQGKALEGIRAKDPAMAQMLQAEALADLLEGLEGTPAGAGSTEPPPVATPIPNDAVGNVTVETVKAEPLVTTETVEVVPADAAPSEPAEARFGVPRGKRR